MTFHKIEEKRLDALPIKLGRFELSKCLVEGAWAQVWSGRHVLADRRVAVKIMTDNRPISVASFEREVQEVASLCHPGIVDVFDYGKVDMSAAERADHLQEGSPYLVMEFAEEGVLRGDNLPRDWDELKDVLLQTLDAFAHTHARGIIHRDVKPENILVFRDPDGNKRYKLTDFGIARALFDHRPDLLEGKFVGTPAFMAPEQFRLRTRDQGPWTDLYSLGCVAYMLCSGELPYQGEEVNELAKSHRSGRPRPLDPVFSVPAAFEQWVLRLLERKWSRRFHHARDAAYALELLAEHESDGTWEQPRKKRTTAITTVPDHAHSSASRSTAIDTVPEVRSHEDEDATVSILPLPLEPAGPPPMPEHWQDGLRPAGDGSGNLGLGLYGFRPTPFVGREPQRQVLWDTLREVHSTGRTRIVLLRGPPGIGKSRLARWISERGYEMGACSVFKASHDPIMGPWDGLERMFIDAMRCAGLNRADALDRVRTYLSAKGRPDGDVINPALSLVAVLYPARERSHHGRHRIFKEFLREIAWERPALLWFDDVQWGRDALQFAINLVENSDTGPLPAMVVVTIRDEALREKPEQAVLLGVLETLAGVHSIELNPLSSSDHARLVQQTVGLSPDLFWQVMERTNGNPLFAEQLVGDWVERGLLFESEAGLELAENDAQLPSSVSELLKARTLDVYDECEGDAQTALELAAALGQRVLESEWRLCCSFRDTVIPNGLVDALVRRRLVRRTQTGWAFSHGMIRESLEQDARTSNRWEGHHRACSDMLLNRLETGSVGLASRLSRHLQAAGAYEEALPWLLDAVDEYQTSTQFTGAHAVIGEWNETIQRLGIDSADPRWIEGWLTTANTLLGQMRVPEACEYVDKAEAAALASGSTILIARVYEIRGDISHRCGEPAEGLKWCTKALGFYRDVEEVLGSARVMDKLGGLSGALGDLVSSTIWYQRAIETFRIPQYSAALPSSLAGLADICWRRGYVDRAKELNKEALALFSESNNRVGMAKCINGLGEAARFRGDFVDAERWYREAIAIVQSIGSKAIDVMRMNLALVQLAQGAYQAAEATLEGVEGGRVGYLGIFRAIELPCLAAQGSWDLWPTYLSEISDSLTSTKLVDHDVAWALELAGNNAASKGRSVEAAQALNLAKDQWNALGKTKRVREVLGLLSKLDAERA